MITNCKVKNDRDLTTCDECHEFSMLSEDKKRCIDCTQLGDGCLRCSINSFDRAPEQCLQCVDNMMLDNFGKCRFNDCYDWRLGRDNNGDATALCTVCDDFMGVDQNDGYTCKSCSVGEGWDDCVDCSMAENGLPQDCL
jgi:hypothetical protein